MSGRPRRSARFSASTQNSTSIVLDDGQRREGLAQADAIGQDAAAVRFELVDDPRGGIALEVEELLPDEAVLVPGEIVGQNVFVDVL
jgi:hypothetical protein